MHDATCISFPDASSYNKFYSLIWATTCAFQQCGILTNVDSDEPVQPPELSKFKFLNLHDAYKNE